MRRRKVQVYTEQAQCSQQGDNRRVENEGVYGWRESEREEEGWQRKGGKPREVAHAGFTGNSRSKHGRDG
jgi:hypothetical protein